MTKKVYKNQRQILKIYTFPGGGGERTAPEHLKADDFSSNLEFVPKAWGLSPFGSLTFQSQSRTAILGLRLSVPEKKERERERERGNRKLLKNYLTNPRTAWPHIP